MWFFKYKVKYYDEDERKEIESHGVTYGEDYSDAVANIVECYDCINSIEVIGLDFEECFYDIPTELWDRL